MNHYQIIRFFQQGGRQIIAHGLSLEEAQEHCHDPETSSRTATSERAQEITAEHGPWFDGYEEE